MRRRVKSITLDLDRLGRDTLCTHEGKCCALGILAIRSGIITHAKLLKLDQEDGNSKLVYDQLRDMYGYIGPICRANDRIYTSPTEKKQKLRQVFADKGIRVRFKNG